MPKKSKVFAIYLAGPVDDVTDSEARDWREEVAAEFPEVFFVVPQDAYRNASMRTASAMEHFNKHLITCSNAVVVNLAGPGRAIGSIREIEFARTHEIYVGVATGDNDYSKSLMTHDLHMHQTPIEATQAALEFLAHKSNQPPTLFGLPVHMPEEDGE